MNHSKQFGNFKLKTLLQFDRLSVATKMIVVLLLSRLRWFADGFHLVGRASFIHHRDDLHLNANNARSCFGHRSVCARCCTGRPKQQDVLRCCARPGRTMVQTTLQRALISTANFEKSIRNKKWNKEVDFIKFLIVLSWTVGTGRIVVSIRNSYTFGGFN